MVSELNGCLPLLTLYSVEMCVSFGFSCLVSKLVCTVIGPCFKNYSKSVFLWCFHLFPQTPVLMIKFFIRIVVRSITFGNQLVHIIAI